MPLARSDVRYYTRRLYEYLRSENTVEFKKHRGYRGMIFILPEKEGVSRISLDHRENILSTLIHEFLHYHHEAWSETDVLRMEKKIINSLSDRQIRNLIKRLAEKL